MKRKTIREILATTKAGEELTVYAWVRTFRNDMFIAVNDGSTIENLQLVLNQQLSSSSDINKINTGASIKATGKIAKSQGKGQKFELIISEYSIIGEANAEKYPIQPKKHSLEFLRENAHLRFRTNTFAAIFRIRHALTFAVHQFFNERGFYNLHTPIITGSDAEGAGEMFRVTTLDPVNPPLGGNKKVDFEKDFFGKETNLTVSGQLEAEMAALALGKVFTFGPTFRAENSNTTRHLAEFWMIEPEVAFADIQDITELAEEFLKYQIQYVLDNCMEDLQFLSNRRIEEEKNKKQEERNEELVEQLRKIVNQEFEKVTYDEAFQILRNSKSNKKKKFNYLLDEWGVDIQTEHERYLVEKHFNKPVIITNYPKDIKAFYMRANDDNKTVSAIDILFPGIGEIIGGSQREERLERLEQRMKEMDIPADEMWWYLDSRKYGSVPHAGFGLGFERLVQFVTGMGNIRDVIPFPRTPKNAEF